MKIILHFIVLILVISCGNKSQNTGPKPSNIIDKESLVKIISEIHLVDAAAKQNAIPNNIDTPTKYGQFTGVIEKYGATKIQFDSTVAYYTRNPKLYLKIYDEILIELEELKAKHPKP